MFPTSRMRRREYNISSVDYHSLTNIELSLINPRRWRTLFGRPNSFMTSLNKSMSLQRIGGGRTRLDSRRRDSIHSPTRVQGKVNNWVNQVGVCIRKISHLKVEINQ
jgi:hypothetical protein